MLNTTGLILNLKRMNSDIQHSHMCLNCVRQHENLETKKPYVYIRTF